MTLPKKNSRQIEVEGEKYRWLVSKHGGVMNLSIESANFAGQLLQARFEPHDYYKSGKNGWQKTFQAVSITPKIVKQIIQIGLANGWKPYEIRKETIQIHRWQSDEFLPELPDYDNGQIRLRDLADSQLDDLIFEISLDLKWRKILFEAEIQARFEIPDDYFAITDEIKKCGFRFAVFNDGWTEGGWVVFGFESIDFPNLTRYSTNNPSIL